MAYYVFDDAKNLFEGMTKEEIIAAIAQATGVTPENIDDGFITTIQEQNAQHGVKLWVGSQNEYNAIQQPDANTLYIVTDPAETNELQNQINQLQAEVNELAVQNTENASGFKIETQTYTKDVYSTDSSLNHNFTVPLNAVVLEASFYYGGSMETTDNVSISETNGETTKTVAVLARFEAPETGVEAVIKLVYAYPEAVDLSELTDIRVGYDGTVYGSAGEAVRKQAFDTRFHDYIKQALLNLLAHVAYTDANGQQYYNELQAAMYMLAGVTSITAVFDQGQNVIYDTDDLDTLRQYLTVTAEYEDGTSGTTNAYILSGTLTVGTSEITVSYGGQTATFEVTVSTHVLYSLENRSFDTEQIDTGIKLLETDHDWTIAFDANITTNPTSGNGSAYRMVVTINHDGSGYALTAGKGTSSASNFAFGFMGPYITLGSPSTGRQRFVLTHAKNSGVVNVKYRKDTGNAVTDSVSGTFTATSYNLKFGHGTTTNALPKGTINKAIVYDNVITDAEINAFLGL